MMKVKLLLIILALLNISCSSLTIVRNKEGKVIQVKGHGLQETSVSKDGEVKHKMEVNWFPKDVLNIYKD